MSTHVYIIKCIILHHSQSDISPLYMASANGHTEVVDVLLKSGANPNLARLVCLIHNIVCLRYWQVILFLSLAYSKSPPHSVSLGVAAERGYTKTVEKLLEGGANINYQDKARNIGIHIKQSLNYCILF